jgi:hypothetical protein
MRQAVNCEKVANALDTMLLKARDHALLFRFVGHVGNGTSGSARNRSRACSHAGIAALPSSATLTLRKNDQTSS